MFANYNWHWIYKIYGHVKLLILIHTWLKIYFYVFF